MINHSVQFMVGTRKGKIISNRMQPKAGSTNMILGVFDDGKRARYVQCVQCVQFVQWEPESQSWRGTPSIPRTSWWSGTTPPRSGVRTSRTVPSCGWSSPRLGQYHKHFILWMDWDGLKNNVNGSDWPEVAGAPSGCPCSSRPGRTECWRPGTSSTDTGPPCWSARWRTILSTASRSACRVALATVKTITCPRWSSPAAWCQWVTVQATRQSSGSSTASPPPRGERGAAQTTCSRGQEIFCNLREWN